MMKKWFKVILTAAFALTFCLSLFFAVNTTTAKADGESYTLAFEGGKVSYVPTDSTAGWWSESGGNGGHSVDGTVATIDFGAAGGTVYHQGVLTLTAGKNYVLSLEYKKVSGDGYFHIYQTGGWTLVKDNIGAGDDWQTFDVVITATASNELIILQDPSQNSVIQFRNINVYDCETMAVTAGAAIGTLPEVPAKEGYKGCWTVDGVEINAETAYNYGADKIAKPAYKENSFKITFEQESGDVSTSLYGWWSQSGANNGQTASESGSEIDFAAAGKTVYNNFTETVVGDTYRLSLSYKKVSGDGKFHVFHGDGWVLVKDWIAASDDWQTLTATYTVSSANELIIFQEPAEANNSVILFKDITLTRIITSKDVKNAEAIGELPEIEAKKGHTGYWTIDGEKITAETVYNYEESKASKLCYEANKYTLTLGETEIEVTYGEAIGDLPEVPAKVGHTGYWTVKDEKITAETVYYETENVTATAKYEANKYTLTLGETEKEVTYGEEIGELPAIETEARKGYEYAWFIDGKRLNEDDVWEYTEDKTAMATETLIQYKIEFKIGDTIVKTVYYTVETEEIEEPAILPREGYTARWEDYTLDGGDKVVNAIYTEVETPGESSSEDGTSAAESGSGAAPTDSTEGTGGCFSGINGLPMLCGILMITACAFVTIKRKNA